MTTTYKLYLPELGLRRPIRSVLPCPKRIKVAWHRDTPGIWELLDEQGNAAYGFPPAPELWHVRDYERAMGDADAREAFYDLVVIEDASTETHEEPR